MYCDTDRASGIHIHMDAHDCNSSININNTRSTAQQYRLLILKTSSTNCRPKLKFNIKFGIRYCAAMSV